jgi:hypothetical protein
MDDSERAILYYWGDPETETLPGVPPRDLTQNDLDRLDAGQLSTVRGPKAAEFVRYDGNKEKRYHHYNKSARPSTIAEDVVADDVEKSIPVVAEPPAEPEK